MKSSLHLLIHCLGKNEKRFFRLYARQGAKKGEHRLLFLFDVMAATPLGEPIRIDRQDAGILRSDLPSGMYKLNKLLMKALRSYHSEKTEGSRLRAEMENLEILFRKGLFTACQRKVQKVRIRASEQEDFHVLLQLTDWDLQLIRALPPTDPISAMQKLNRIKRELLEMLQEKEEALASYRIVFMISKLRPTQIEPSHRELLAASLEAPALQQSAPPRTLVGKTCRLVIPGLQAMQEGKYKEAIETFDKARSLFDGRHHLIQQHADIYRVTLTNLLNACLLSGEQARYKSILDDLPNIRMESRTDKRRLQVLLYYSDLLYCLNYWKKERGTRLVKDIQLWISKNLDEFETDVLFNFYYNSCLFHFMHGNYKDAIQLLNMILHSKGQDLRQDIYDYAHLFQMVVHWELGNTDLLEYQIQNVRRYVKSREIDREYELRIIAFFVKALDQPEMEQLRPHMEDLRDFLAGLLSATGPRPLGCQELVLWLESKLAGMHISDYAQQVTH